MQKRCCFIIDLDFTLVNLDTTEEFLKMLCPLKYSIFSKILKPAVILGRFFNIDLYKQLLLFLCIYGYSKRFLEEKAKIFFETLVSKGHINTLLLHSIQKNDCTKILLTASLDIIAIRFYDLGFDLVISSTSLFRHEKFIGIRDLYKNKHKIVYALSKLFQKVMIFEDSPEPEYRIVKNTKIISVFYGKK